MSYTGKVYRPDADTLVIADGGKVNIEKGAAIRFGIAAAANIAEITDTASGGQIATAVNAIIAALIGAGIVAPPAE
ncbi:MAG: hypothetical protein WAO24_04180 [Peptococcia bacterium]